jgi:hypothetical protein
MDWSQLRTVLWLRWRLTRNQWSRRGGRLNAVLTILAVVAGVLIGLGGCVAGVIGGAVGLARASPQVMLFVWDLIVFSFLFLWLLGLLAEIQRSETIDLGRLLHLPVSLRWIFVVNYLASHLTLSLIVFLPGALGLCAGLLLGRGWAMILLVPLVLGFVFMITAWTYCLRGWLVSLMVNKRRRRSILMGVTLAAILLGQVPNLYVNLILRHERRRAGESHSAQADDPASAQNSSSGHQRPASGFLEAHRYVPPLWVANGAMRLAEGNVWPAVWASMALAVMGAAGLARAYRSTIRFYQGQEQPVEKRAAERTVRVRGKNLLERRVPGVAEETAALSLACFQSLTRAPEVKMSLVTNLIVLVIVPVAILSGGLPPPVAGDMATPFIATGAVAFTFFGLLQLMFNQFGFDRDGFRALVLLPVGRGRTLLAKNLSLAPIAFGMGGTLLVILKVLVHLPLLVFLAACFQLAATFLLLSIAGNFLSIVTPYRIGAGSLKPTKATGKTTLLIFVSHLLFPVAMVPIFLPPTLGWLCDIFGAWPAPVVNALLSLLLAALVALLYRLSLRALGDLLQRREMDILQVVSQEVE